MSLDIKIDSRHSISYDRKKNWILKRVSGDAMEVELRMTRNAYDLAVESGKFRVPNVLDHNAEEGWIAFEYIPNIQSSYKLITANSLIRNLVVKLGDCLGYLHNNLKLDNEHIFELPDVLNPAQLKGSSAFLHGDFTLDNVQYDASNDQIVILDWSLTPLMGSIANWGTVYWDLGWMATSIITVPPYIYFKDQFRTELVKLFLNSYIKHSRFEIDDIDFSQYLDQIYQIFSKKERKNLKLYQLKKIYYYLGHWGSRGKFRII